MNEKNIRFYFRFTTCDDIKINNYAEAQQPDGTWLITLNVSNIESSGVAVYVRVLTSSAKKNLKYGKFQNGDIVKLEGDLDLLVTGTMLASDSSSVNLTAVITVIDFL